MGISMDDAWEEYLVENIESIDKDPARQVAIDMEMTQGRWPPGYCQRCGHKDRYRTEYFYDGDGDWHWSVEEYLERKERTILIPCPCCELCHKRKCLCIIAKVVRGGTPQEAFEITVGGDLVASRKKPTAREKKKLLKRIQKNPEKWVEGATNTLEYRGWYWR